MHTINRATLAGWLVAAVLAGLWIGHLVTPNLPPLCEEDEVMLAEGRCLPLDDAEYVGGVGWVDMRHAR